MVIAFEGGMSVKTAAKDPQKLGEYVEKLSRMLACRTVWTREGVWEEEFQKFYALLPELFPRVCAQGERLTFGGGCFFYKIPGKNATRNLLLMSHHDVVDGGDGWSTDPFRPEVKGQWLYGRGTIDTKTPLFAQLQACEELLEAGFSFQGFNLYIGSSHNEEVSGDGMVLAAQYFQQQGIHFDLVLDEGGAITEGQIPGFSGKSALIAVHEKSRHLFSCRAVVKTGGHGGFTAKRDSAVERLSGFVSEVSRRERQIYPGHLYPEVKETFARHASSMAFPMNLVFGHMGLFAPLIRKLMMGIPAAAPMLSTQVSFTTFRAGDRESPQVRAREAECTMLLRCVREEDLYRGLDEIRAIGERYGVEVTLLERDYCHQADFHSPAFHLVESVVGECFPEVVVAPFLLTAGTDARRLTQVADQILRFAPIELSKAQFATIHGADEHIGLESIGRCVDFYEKLVSAFGK